MKFEIFIFPDRTQKIIDKQRRRASRDACPTAVLDIASKIEQLNSDYALGAKSQCIALEK